MEPYWVNIETNKELQQIAHMGCPSLKDHAEVAIADGSTQGMKIKAESALTIPL